MTLEPLFHAPLAVQIHAATVIPAFFIGTWQIFLSRKGAPSHRAMGYLYLGLMTVTAVTALFIHQIMPNSPFFGLSPIHLFVPLTLFGVASALYGAWTHNIRAHRGAMLGVYIGGLLIAGSLAFHAGTNHAQRRLRNTRCRLPRPYRQALGNHLILITLFGAGSVRPP